MCLCLSDCSHPLTLHSRRYHRSVSDLDSQLTLVFHVASPPLFSGLDSQLTLVSRGVAASVFSVVGWQPLTLVTPRTAYLSGW